MDAIQVQNLTRAYGDLYAVDDISFAVKAGEIFGFLGPNGAGKTTTIRVLTGQLRPTSGQATVVGCDVVEDRQLLKPQIGVVFEYQNIYERLSARDNLTFAARLYGVEKARVEQREDEKILEWYETAPVGGPGVAPRTASALSR